MKVLTTSTNHSSTGLIMLQESLQTCVRHGEHYNLTILGEDGSEFVMWRSKFMFTFNALRCYRFKYP